MAYYLGIDLGTTYTAAAIERDGLVEALTLGNRTASVPSVVFLRDDGEILVGEAATRRAMSEPGRVGREFKRRVGDPTPIILGGTPYAAEMLMARLLRWSVDRVREQQGTDPLAIALTHPANWGPYKLDLLTQAVRQVDIDAALMLPEPVAAATFYASQRRLDPQATVAVYDLGGGTFDAAMVRRTSQGFEIMGSPEGIERLGGIDFDEAVYAHVRAAIGDALDQLDPEEPAAVAALARLRQECIDAKEALSSDTDVSIPVLLPNLQTEVRLTRSEFEDMIRPAINETIVALRRSIRSASVSSDVISAVLLVGGSSRIPLVAQMVAAELGRPIAIDAHPKDAISFGAAIAVAQLKGKATPESVTTLLPRDSRPPPPTQSPDTQRPAPPQARPAPPQQQQPPAAAARPAPPTPSPTPTPQRPLPPRPAPPAAPAPPTPVGTQAAHAAAPPTHPSPPAVTSPVQTATSGQYPAQQPARPPVQQQNPAAYQTPQPGVPAQNPAARSAPPPNQPLASPLGGTPAVHRPGPTLSGAYTQTQPRTGYAANSPSGGYPAQRPSGGGGDGEENRTPLIIAIVVVAVILVVLVAFLATKDSGGGSDNGGSSSDSSDTTGDSPPETETIAEGYTQAIQDGFMQTCQDGGTANYCTCVLDELKTTIRVEDLQSIVADWDPASGDIPPELNDVVSGCLGSS
ncbi:MAG TPA: Hsp70 family protein [Acidimicrobiales bacterium]|jgi:actin-like ATPase involved in cell morphogenesis